VRTKLNAINSKYEENELNSKFIVHFFMHLSINDKRKLW